MFLALPALANELQYTRVMKTMGKAEKEGGEREHLAARPLRALDRFGE
jgi:hypothetical protein